MWLFRDVTFHVKILFFRYCQNVFAGRTLETLNKQMMWGDCQKHSVSGLMIKLLIRTLYKCWSLSLLLARNPCSALKALFVSGTFHKTFKLSTRMLILPSQWHGCERLVLAMLTEAQYVKSFRKCASAKMTHFRTTILRFCLNLCSRKQTSAWKSTVICSSSDRD